MPRHFNHLESQHWCQPRKAGREPAISPTQSDTVEFPSLDVEPLLNAYELEARVLYSATPIPLDVDGGLDTPDLVSHDSFEATGALPLEVDADWSLADSILSDDGPISFESLRSADAATREVFFVDTSVEDYERIVDHIIDHNPDALLELIDSQFNGLQQITDTLESEHGLDAVHLISHGSNRGLQLGSTELSINNIEEYSSHFRVWASALAEDADILIYGCDVASETSGRQFLMTLGSLTSADIAASSDLTGHADLGGDWDLEFTSGEIQTQIAFASQLEFDWQSTLAAVNNIGDFNVTPGSIGSQETSGVSRGSHQAVAVVDNGSVVVYTDSQADGDGEGVFAQRYNTVGDPIGTAIQVNVDTAGDQESAVVAADAMGRFAVAYMSSDGDSTGIFLRRFEADGTPIDSDDVFVNIGQSVSDQLSPSLSVNATGQLVVAWESNGVHEGIYARTFDMDSAAPGSQLATPIIRVEADATAQTPTVDMNNAGRFVVAWEQGGELYGRRYDYGNPTALSEKHDLNVGNTGANVVVAVQEDSDFVAAFRVNGAFIDGVWRRQFNADGSATGSSQAVDLSGSANSPSIGMAVDGSFIVSYESNDADGLGVFARKYDFDNNSVGGRFQINTATTSDQSQVSVAVYDIDNFVAVWTGDELGSDNVYARQFGDSQKLVVTTTSDVLDGDVSSMANLLANKGADGLISLREAIAATNQTANASGLDKIEFDLPNSEGRFYYQDDGLANSLSVVATTTLDESAITDFDPDYVGSPFTWFRINLDSALPALTVTEAVKIDGYSQEGAVENTSTLEFNAQIRVELTLSAGNANAGLVFSGTAGNSIVQGLAIHGFGSHGILVEEGADSVTVRGNIIGADPALQVNANSGSGIRIHADNVIVGGSNLSNRNLISGNAFSGVEIRGTSVIAGGLIENNIIHANANHGLLLQQTDGVEVIDNVITGNAYDGIRALSGGSVINTVIQGNSIGVSADGLLAQGNAGSGIRLEADVVTGTLIGGTAAGEGNVVGASVFSGIALDGQSVSGTSIFGNFIGTNALQTVAFANGLHGVRLTENAVNNQIGGVLAGQANVIAHNTQAGVALVNSGVGTGTGHGNSIRGNQFVGQGGLAIDIFADGVTDNDATLLDADVGPNRVQNYPELTEAVLAGGDLTVIGVLEGEAATDYVIDFYSTPVSDSSGHGQAARYLGTLTSADFGTTDVTGTASFSFTVASTVVNAGEFITATATHSDGSTSEFSANALVTLPNVAPVLGNNQLTISEGQTVTIGTSNLSANDIDDDNGLLTFEVSSVLGGRFALATDTATAITSFTQNQVAAGEVVFVDNGDEAAPGYDVSVTDGALNSGPTAATISFNNTNDAPVVTVNQLSVTEGQAVTITSANLAATDVDDADPALTFSVASLSGGKFALAADAAQVAITSFTQAQVAAGQIVFVDDGDNTAPAFELTATDGFATSAVSAANIAFNNGNDAPVLVNNQLTVSEGQIVTIDNAQLAATDIDHADASLTFTVSSVSGGRFALAADTANAIFDFTQSQVVAGQVVFVDDGNELPPGYEVSVSDGVLATVPEAAVVAFGGSNDAPTVAAPMGAITVNEDSPNRTIDLSVVFSDVDDATLSYSVIGNSNQSLVSANTSGSQLILDFLPNRFGDSTVTVQARDAAGAVVQDVLSIVVMPVNDRPTAEAKQYTLAEDGTASGNLLVGANDLENDALTPVITRAPISGDVVLNPDGTFVFTAGDEFAGVVDFEFAVTDGVATSESQTVRVLAPVVVANTPIALPSSSSEVSVEVTSEESEEEAEESTAEPVLKGKGASPVEEEDSFPSPEPRKTMIAEPVVDAKSESTILLEPENDIEKVCFQRPQLNETSTAGTTQSVVQAMATMNVATTDFSTALLSSVNAFQEDLASANESIAAQKLTTVVSLSGVSIGVVTWVLRSGAFVASMLANLPAWRMIDPLVVLGHSESDDGSDESLLDIVEDNQPRKNGDPHLHPDDPSVPVYSSSPKSKRLIERPKSDEYAIKKTNW